jgi:amidophosphoribosyltransferase
VAGAFSPVPADLPRKLFFMLFSLQHRGQESAGIAWEDPGSETLESVKGTGMVREVLGSFSGDGRLSRIAVGHVRYSTSGGSGLRNAQPLVVECDKGRIALAHNGNISNSAALRAELSAEGAIFQSTSDTELILHLMARSRKSDPEEIVREAFSRLEGAYSAVMAWNGELWAVRDPHGFRPLYLASEGESRLVASETCALLFGGPLPVREIEPGETYRSGPAGDRSFSLGAEGARGGKCSFELIYFARPDSEVFGKSVHETRRALGAALADIDTERGDVVIPVPDSGNVAAMGYAGRAGLPFDFGLCRNHYAGRSFIMPTTIQRELAVRMKLMPVRSVVSGKRVILVDDSLVRGTTSKIIVRLLKEAGARSVHLRLSSPEIHNPCYFGIDIPTREELISNRMDAEGIAREVGADSVLFLPAEKLDECLGPGCCKACFDGAYPCPIPPSTRAECK